MALCALEVEYPPFEFIATRCTTSLSSGTAAPPAEEEKPSHNGSQNLKWPLAITVG